MAPRLPHLSMSSLRPPSRILAPLLRKPRLLSSYSSASSLTSESPTSSTNPTLESPEPTPTPFTPPIPPPPSQTNHSSLSTFLTHARRTSLSPTSTTYIGTHYEYTCLQTLRSLGLSLTRVGGRADSGIDLLGLWHLPTVLHPLRVIVQCKALKAKLSPNLMRELEGAFVGAPMGWRGEGVLGVMVSKREATRGVREAMGRSRWPLVWMGVETEDADAVKDGEGVEGDEDGYREGRGVV